MTRLQLLFRSSVAVLAAAAACALVGCPSASTTTGYTPITGILIRGSSLVADHGCGTGPQQVYKYAAVAYYEVDGGPSGPPVVSGVFDCFTDGLFSNLQPSASGNLSFTVAIFAYSQASFPPTLQCPPTSGACPGDDPATTLGFAGQAGWTTTCTATQQAGVSVLAVCAPLEPAPNGGADGGDAGGDAAPDASGDAAPEAAVEAGGEAGSDTGSEGGADATGDAGGDGG
ncbi:MAG TPA: hypothetical protein VIF09_22385 [Polyangiaceae bacterium]